MTNVLIICTIGIIISMYVIIRNAKVHKFRLYLINLIYDKVDAVNFWDARRLFDKHTYRKMLYSFKPLKMEYWFTDDELKLLGYEIKRLD